MMRILRDLMVSALCALGVAQIAEATKTAPPLPVQISVAPSSTQPGQLVEYSIAIPNNSKSAYWGTDLNVSFPSQVTCEAVVAEARHSCKLTGNTLNCHWNDYYAGWNAQIKVTCRVNAGAVCGSEVSTTANLSVMKPMQNTSSSAALSVKCNTPTPTSIPTQQATRTPTPVLPTATPCHTPSATPTPTPTVTPQPTRTPIPQPTKTPTPQPTPCHECADGIDNDGDGKIDFPADPDCESAQDESEGGATCAYYSVLRQIRGGFRGDPVALKEEVEVLPDGEHLACLQAILAGNQAPCLTYPNFPGCPDPFIRSELERHSQGGQCFGMSELTYNLLKQACDIDPKSKECEQFLALSAYRSNDLPLSSVSTGVKLCRDHNPRTQYFIVDSACKLILEPTPQQEYHACPAAVITGTVWNYVTPRFGGGGRRR